MPSYLDLGLLAVVLVSALLAMLRGFTREVLAIASWGAAAIAAIHSLVSYRARVMRHCVHYAPPLCHQRCRDAGDG